MAWDNEAAEVATLEAERQYHKMLKSLTPEERAGVDRLVAFWKFWYNGNEEFHATGDKALARIITGRKALR